jgi:hypothetical protein
VILTLSAIVVLLLPYQRCNSANVKIHYTPLSLHVMRHAPRSNTQGPSAFQKLPLTITRALKSSTYFIVVGALRVSCTTANCTVFFLYICHAVTVTRSILAVVVVLHWPYVIHYWQCVYRGVTAVLQHHALRQLEH